MVFLSHRPNLEALRMKFQTYYNVWIWKAVLHRKARARNSALALFKSLPLGEIVAEY